MMLAPAVAPPTRTNDQIFPSRNWVPIGKSNYVLDVQKSQRNHIFLIFVALLKNPNFFRAFTASSTIPAIYIQQDALDITPTNDNNPFVAPPLSDIVIEYVNTLGYPSTLRNVSIWDEFVQSVQTFLTNMRNLATASRRKKKTTHLLIPNIRYVGKDGREIFEEGGATKSSKATKITPDEPSPAKRSKGGLVRKIRKPMSSLKLVDEPSAKDVMVKELAYNEEEANLQWALELSLKEQAGRTQGPAHPVVIREPDSRRIQLLPEINLSFRGALLCLLKTRDLLNLSLDAELALTDSETKFDDEVPKINTRDQDEGQAGPNPEATDASNLQNPEQIDEEFTTTAYLSVQENLKLPSKDQISSSWRSNRKKIQGKPMQNHSLLEHNLALEERLDKHGSRLYKLKNLNIPHQVRKAVDEIVIDAVDWAMQAPLRARFSDLPTIDMKEILQQRMFESKSYEAHEDHKKLYDALEKSLERDYSDQLLSDLDEAHQKKRKRHGVPRTPSGSPPPQPPPPPPPTGTSSAPGTSRASGSSQFPQHLHLLSTGTSGSTKKQGNEASSFSKSAALAPYYIGWTISDTRYESAGVSRTQELSPIDSLIQDDSIPDEQIHLFDDEDSQNDQLPKADLRKDYKGSSPALSISKMKAASYPNFGLELLMPEQIHDSLSHRKEVRSHMRILSVVRIKAYSRYEYDYLSKIVLRRADLQEHMIAEKDFKNLHLNTDFRSTGLHSQGIQDQVAQSGYEYTFLDSKVCDKEQRVYRGYSKATKDKKDLSESGMLCCWTSS
nr:hypothetical protein [Tanacetum cinerariifolium]